MLAATWAEGYEVIPESVLKLAGLVYSDIGALCQLAIFFLLLSVFIHRRDLRNVLLRMLPSSTRVNLTTYLIDSLLIAGPISYLAIQLNGHLKSAGLVLPLRSIMEEAPVALVAVLAIFVGDLIGYFRHRLEHSALLWPTHVMHHSDDQMNWLTLFRFHPLNRLTTTVIDTCALFALGFPPWALVVNQLVRHYYGVFIHANLPWTYGSFGKVFVSPAMHRWHHVRQGPGVSCNFATIFAVFDRAFGTYYVPGACEAPTGLDGVNDKSYVAQILYPFRSALSPLLRTFSRHKLVRPAPDKAPVIE